MSFLHRVPCRAHPLREKLPPPPVANSSPGGQVGGPGRHLADTARLAPLDLTVLDD